ncbi:tripartite tricarboxylate transporter substrate binding protein [Variovorax sp. LjRoot178]|uniref:tripartite tricarboxylate transporter substrate binding protein n=1 Tax=Variovorax sp. LjRoot178 TaxID=3342277 RepID=UPI003F5130B5
MLADNVAQQTGQPLIVENRPGVASAMPAFLLQNAEPDGYTLGQGTSGVLRLGYMQRLNWDPLQDLSFIAGISGYLLGVVVRADSPFTSATQLIDWARANPGRLNYGSTGVLTGPHVAMEDIALRLSLRFNHVPYKGSADLMQAVLSGHVMAAADSSGFIPHVEAGKLRLLCTGETSMARFPGVPTLRDLGLPMGQKSRYGLIGPRGMDSQLVERIHEVFKRAMEQTNHLEALARFDQQLIYMSPADYRRFAVGTVASERVLMERLASTSDR